MARLLRSTTESVLRKPAAIDPPVVFAPIRVQLIATRRSLSIAANNERGTTWKLGMPVSVAPATVFNAVRVGLAPSPTLARRLVGRLNYTLRPPVAVSASSTFGPVHRSLARSPRPPKVTSRLVPPQLPVVVPPILAGLEIRLAPSARQARKSYAKLRQPTVVGSSTVFAPITTHFAPSPKQARKSGWLLRPPVAVAAAVVSAPLRVFRTFQPPTVARKTASRLFPIPSFVVTVFAPVRVLLARTGRRPPVASKLRPPVTIGASTVFAPVKVRLVTQPRQAQKNQSVLRAPTVLGPVVQALAAPVRVLLARSSRKVQAQSRLRAPTAVAPSVTFPAVRVKTVQPPGQARKSSGRLLALPPQPLLFIAAPIRVLLSKTLRRRIQANSRLCAPTVTAPANVFAPIERTLAPSSKLARQPHSRLRPPIVVAASVVSAPIRRTFAAFSGIRRYIARLRAPAVVTPFVPPSTVYGGVLVSDSEQFNTLVADSERFPVAVGDGEMFGVQANDVLSIFSLLTGPGLQTNPGLQTMGLHDQDANVSDTARGDVGVGDLPGG